MVSLAAALWTSGCQGHQYVLPADWEHPRAASGTVAPVLPVGPDALAEEDALRALIKPPALCFTQPALCGVAGPSHSLAALRPDENLLDAVATAWNRHEGDWPLPSLLLHCETLTAWRPTAGYACVERLSQRGLQDAPLLHSLLGLLDALGPYGNSLALRWLAHPDVAVRREVARWLGTRAADDALVVPVMEALNKEADAQAGAHLARALATLRDMRTMVFMERLLMRTHQPSVRAELIRALTWLSDPSRRARFLQRLPTLGPADAEARSEALAALADQQDTPALVPADLPGAYDFWALAPAVDVGGLAFVETFRRRHGRPLDWASGEPIERAELDELMTLLKDGGGVGLDTVRNTMAMSCTAQDLPGLLDLRRAIHVAGLPNRDMEARRLTELLMVVRTHHRAGRATPYFMKVPHAAGPNLKFMP